MALSISHAFHSAIADDPASVAAGQVVPSNWNADHTVVGSQVAGSNTQLQYNNSGSFGGTSNLTWNGSTLTGPDTGTWSSTALAIPTNILVGGVSIPGVLSSPGNIFLSGETGLWGFNGFGFHVAAFAINMCTTASGTGLIDSSLPGWAFNMQVGGNDGFFVSRTPAGGAPTDFVNFLVIDSHGQITLSAGFTVATLPAGTTGGRGYVTDSNLPMAANYGATIAGHGGGVNTVPVFYDGANWRIG